MLVQILANLPFESESSYDSKIVSLKTGNSDIALCIAQTVRVLQAKWLFRNLRIWSLQNPVMRIMLNIEGEMLHGMFELICQKEVKITSQKRDKISKCLDDINNNTDNTIL